MAYLDTTPGAGLTIAWEDSITHSVENAIAYLQSKWAAFLALSPRIIDLQHRAAEAAYAASQRGDTFAADQAKLTIKELARLQDYHGRIVDKMQTVAQWTGLSGHTGLGAIPAAQVALITGLALVVVWFFRSFEYQERKLDLIEAGTITPEQAAALDPGPVPSEVLGGIGDLAKFALGAFALWVLLQAIQGGRVFRSNPDLAVFDTNPPGGVFGEEVYAVWYRHSDDGNPYVHEFDRGVELEALPDGSVLLSHPTRRLWEEF